MILWWLKEDGHHGSMIKDPTKNVGQTTDFSHDIKWGSQIMGNTLIEWGNNQQYDMALPKSQRDCMEVQLSWSKEVG